MGKRSEPGRRRGGAQIGRRAVVACVLALPVALACRGAAAAETTATPGRAVTLPLAAPAGAGDTLLELRVSAYTPPRSGGVEAVVTLRRGGRAVEVGRFAVFPAEPFGGGRAAGSRAWLFDAGAALAALGGSGPLSVTLRLAPFDARAGAPGAAMTIAGAVLRGRP